MILKSDCMPAAGFNDWLAAEAGTRMWCLAPRLTDRLRDKGYDLAIPTARYDALQRRHTAQLIARCFYGLGAQIR